MPLAAEIEDRMYVILPVNPNGNLSRHVRSLTRHQTQWEEEGQGGVQHDVAVEVLVRLVEHSAVVARVDVVAPSVLGRVDVEFWHTHHAHLLVIPIALNPSHPVTTWDSAQPHDG